MGKAIFEVVGNAWVFGDDIDTDQIISGRHLRILDYTEMVKHTFETIRPGFAEKVKQNDIIIAGRNFGSGSSREEASMVLVELGIGCVIAESFARIFYRNAFNVGLPVMIIPKVNSKIRENEKIKVDLQTGILTIIESGQNLKGEAIPELMLDFIHMGGAISRYLKNKK
jgi:3-isopropylmalate/(R)-2-methylmalate dehydratase small subunit